MNPGTCSYVLVIRHSVLVVHFENPSWHDSFLISLSDDDFIKSSRLYMEYIFRTQCSAYLKGLKVGGVELSFCISGSEILWVVLYQNLAPTSTPQYLFPHITSDYSKIPSPCLFNVTCQSEVHITVCKLNK